MGGTLQRWPACREQWDRGEWCSGRWLGEDEVEEEEMGWGWWTVICIRSVRWRVLE